MKAPSRIAMHEAGHAVVMLALDRRFEIVTIRENPRMGVRGWVGPSILRRSSAEIEREHWRRGREGPLEIIASLSDEWRADFVTRAGSISYAGAAAECWRYDDVDNEAFFGSVIDRIQHVEDAALVGVEMGHKDRASWRRACDLVDARFGEVVSVAAALDQNHLLAFDDVERIVAQAPALTNHRRPMPLFDEPYPGVLEA